MMTDVKLGGVLGKEFGYVWRLDIDTPAEAIRAIEANRPGFAQRLIDLAGQGVVYRVRLDRREIGESELGARSGGQCMVILPTIWGAGAGAKVLAGAAIVAAAYYFGGPAGGAVIGASAQTAGYAVGASMFIGGVVQMLTPVASLGTGNNASRNSAYAFGSTDNVSGQGYAIPVGYGRCMTGSIIVNAGVYAEDMSSYSSANPALLSTGGK